MTVAARKAFTDFPLSQQAGILCNDPQFQSFAGTRSVKSGVIFNPSACAAYIRTICMIESRSALDQDTHAADRFERMRTEFDAWRGRIARQRG